MTPEDKAKEVRRFILETALADGKGHVASALSWVEIAVALKAVMKPGDRLVLSKTHGHLALDALWQDPDYPMWPGWPHKCSGSLGQGLGMAAGMALANKLNGSKARVFCVLGDAELHEGSVWEAVMFAAHHHLNNLIAIIDNNKQSCADFTRDVMSIDPICEKFHAFMWDRGAWDGHDIPQLRDALTITSMTALPRCIVANTVKGRGISFMEGNPAFHHQLPVGDQIETARGDLK